LCDCAKLTDVIPFPLLGKALFSQHNIVYNRRATFKIWVFSGAFFG